MGPPDKTTSDGLDGQVFVYDRFISLGQTAGQVFRDSWGNLNYTTPQQRGLTFRRMFFLNREGKIYLWKTEAL